MTRIKALSSQRGTTFNILQPFYAGFRVLKGVSTPIPQTVVHNWTTLCFFAKNTGVIEELTSYKLHFSPFWNSVCRTCAV